MLGIIGKQGDHLGWSESGESHRRGGESSSKEQILENHVDHDKNLGFYS